jgi:hypothetical protein
VTAISDPLGIFTTDAMSFVFTDLPAGQTSGLMDLFLNTSQLGNFSGQYQFSLSDEQDLSGWAGGQTLTLNVTADVVPEPSTLALLCGAALFGYGLRRRLARRTAKSAAFDQQNTPTVLTFHSHVSVSAARRAA